MMRVKIIRTTSAQLEGEMNDFFDELGHQQGFVVELEDIDFQYIGTQQDLTQAVITYNIYQVEKPKPINTVVRPPRPKVDYVYGTKGREETDQ